jgi:hypothetical protein
MEISPYDVNFQDDQQQHEILMDAMLAKALTLLYEGSTTNMLSTILLLLNLRIVHGVSNVFMNELLSFLHLELLPKVNKMSAITYKALKLVKTLGLNYDSIHACTYNIKFQFIVRFFYIIFFFFL